MIYTPPIRCAGSLTIMLGEGSASLYADPELQTPLENPLPGDSAGRLPPIYLAEAEYQVDDGGGAVAVTPAFLPLSVSSSPYTDEAGNSLAWATRTFYASRTSELAEITDGVDPIDNPQTANGSGVFPETHLDDSKEYRVVLKDQSGNLVYDHEVRGFYEEPPPDDQIGGTVVFTAADISGAGGSSPRGYNSATATDWIGDPSTCLAAGSLTSGNLAGKTDFGIGTFVGSGNELSVRLRVAAGTERPSPQTAYFTGLTIAGIESGLTAGGATFATDTTSDPGFTTYTWGWIMIDNLMLNSTEYTAVFT